MMSSGGSGSRSRNFRRRSEDDANAEERDKASSSSASTVRGGGGGKGESASQTLAGSKANKPRTLLSFADDEEEGPARRPAAHRPSPSGSSSSSKHTPVHKITFSKERAAGTPLPKASMLQPQAGEYTKEKLLELQKNARPLGSLPKTSVMLPPSSVIVEPPKPVKAETSAKPVIVLKGLEGLVRTVAVQEKVEAPGAAARQKQEQGEEMQEVEELQEKSGDLQRRRLAGLGIDGRGKDPSLIPDQATINAIRAKRERLRQSQVAAPDYISLDGSGAPTGSGGLSSDEEDNDFRGRMSLLGEKVETVSRKGVFESFEERSSVVERRVVETGVSDVVDEEDDEERIWEEEQLRIGLGKRFEEASSGKGVNGLLAVPAIQPQPSVYSVSTLQSISNSVSLDAGFGVSRSANIMSISQQAEVATRALRESIGKLKETHNRTLYSLLKVDQNLSESLSIITSLPVSEDLRAHWSRSRM